MPRFCRDFAEILLRCEFTFKIDSTALDRLRTVEYEKGSKTSCREVLIIACEDAQARELDSRELSFQSPFFEE